MQQDIRDSALFHEASDMFAQIYRPGSNFVSDITDIQLSSEKSRLLFTGAMVSDLEGCSATRICEFDLQSGLITTLTSGPHSDHFARLSPDGSAIAFLSDRARPSDFQLYFLDPRTHETTPGPVVEGWVEYLEWSPTGRRILLGVAGYGAELSSGQGAHSDAVAVSDQPSWMPRILGSSSEAPWRRIWVFDFDAGQSTCVSSESQNIWEASWCGETKLVAIASHDPQEGAWYAAEMVLIDLATGDGKCLYIPDAQLALPRASPCGQTIAFLEAISSDRGFVAGDLRLYDLRDGSCRLLDTQNVDVTHVEWRSDHVLMVAGHRGLETVVLSITIAKGSAEELWKSLYVSTSGRCAIVLGLERAGDFAFVSESFFKRPQIATVRSGLFELAPVHRPKPELFEDSGIAEAVRWHASDGMQIEGWLIRPRSQPPYPTLLCVHAGPVIHWRPYWLGRAPLNLMLLTRGYALLLPNPRGSSGRGQSFAAHVVGDVGGADTSDLLSGIDHLVGAGIADPSRLAITGLSYGGFMSCWLPTQDTRFAAAIAVGPATNHVSQHLLCNIPQFQSLFLQDHYTNLAGKYYSRSPILQAHLSRTPTLLVGGDLDRCTPAEEAVQFQNALLENRVDAVVVRYPEEGHGVHAIPAAIDFSARSVMWLEQYLTGIE